ncbi:MAG TPA: antitoxin family protein [Anaerolineae bacterium]|nr:antitoxin family protein [Anaerolineae bacterium]
MVEAQLLTSRPRFKNETCSEGVGELHALQRGARDEVFAEYCGDLIEACRSPALRVVVGRRIANSDGTDLYHLVYNLDWRCPMAVLTTRAIYKDGVLKPTTKLDLPDGTTVEVQISALPLAISVDPKDSLMDDEPTLQAMYAEFAEEDRHLAEAGLQAYARTLKREEDRA